MIASDRRDHMEETSSYRYITASEETRAFISSATRGKRVSRDEGAIVGF